MASSRRPPRVRPSLLGKQVQNLQPKLRMIANGDLMVNTIRAELSAALKITDDKLLRKTPQIRGPENEAVTKKGFREAFKRKTLRSPHLKSLARSVLTNVFIHTTTPDPLPEQVVKESGRRGRIAKARNRSGTGWTLRWCVNDIQRERILSRRMSLVESWSKSG